MNSTQDPVNMTSLTSTGFKVLRDTDLAPAKMDLYEIPGEYIEDYAEYRKVLEGCNHTLYTETYPEDGECFFSLF